MKYVYKKFLVFVLVLTNSCLMVPALASTSVARYRASNPLVAGGSSDNWNYPAWMAEDKASGYEYPTAQASDSALEKTQNYLQETSKNTAVTQWQGSRDIVQPVYVTNSEVTQFSQPSSGMERFNKPSSWFSQRNYYKDSQDMPEVSSYQELNKISSIDKQGLKKGRNKKEEMTEKQYFHDQQDRYAHRKQMFKDALIILLTKYAVHHMTDEEVEQEEHKLLASLNRDLDFYSAIPQEQVDADLSDIVHEYMLEKENIKNEKIETEKQLNSRYSVRSQDLKHNYEKPHKMMNRLEKKSSEDIMPLEEIEKIYYHPESSKKVSRSSLMQNVLPSEEIELAQEPREKDFITKKQLLASDNMMSRLEKKSSEDIVPLEEIEKIYYRPELSKKVSRSSLMQNVLPSEEVELIQEPREKDLVAGEPVQLSALSSIDSQSKSVFRTDREKQVARDMIHNKHVPFLKNKLRERNHRGMITKNLLQNLIKEYNLHILHPDDVIYTQGALQANFM